MNEKGSFYCKYERGLTVLSDKVVYFGYMYTDDTLVFKETKDLGMELVKSSARMQFESRNINSIFCTYQGEIFAFPSEK